MTSFQVDRFEASDADGGFVPLRLDGRWISPEPIAVAAPVLLVRSGAALERIEPSGGTDLHPIATPAGDDWQARFDVPATLIESSEAGFALEVAGGLAFALPDPSSAPGSASGAPQDAPAAPSAEVPTASAPTAGRADHEFEALQEAVRELQLRLEAERRARRTAEDQLEQELQGRQVAAPPAALPTVDAERVQHLQTMVAELESRMRASGAFSAASSDDQLRELEQRLNALEQSNAALERRASEAEREAHTLREALETTREAQAQAVARSHGQQGAPEDDSRETELAVAGSDERLAELEARSAQIESRAAELEASLTEARLAAEQSAARVLELQAHAERPAEEAPPAPEPMTALDDEADAESAVGEAVRRKRALRLLLIVLSAVGVLLAAEAGGLVSAWPLNP